MAIFLILSIKMIKFWPSAVYVETFNFIQHEKNKLWVVSRQLHHTWITSSFYVFSTLIKLKIIVNGPTYKKKVLRTSQECTGKFWPALHFPWRTPLRLDLMYCPSFLRSTRIRPAGNNLVDIVISSHFQLDSLTLRRYKNGNSHQHIIFRLRICYRQHITHVPPPPPFSHGPRILKRS